MSKRNRTLDGLGLALVLAGTGWPVHRGTANGWGMLTDSPAPKDQTNLEVDLPDAVAWAVISGAAVGLARMLVRRKLAYPHSPLDDHADVAEGDGVA